jgi:hypothetical protein
VGIAIRTDQSDHLDAVATHLLHHIAEDREGGDGFDLVGGVRSAAEAEQNEQRQSDRDKDAMFHDTRIPWVELKLRDVCAARGPT